MKLIRKYFFFRTTLSRHQVSPDQCGLLPRFMGWGIIRSPWWRIRSHSGLQALQWQELRRKTQMDAKVLIALCPQKHHIWHTSLQGRLHSLRSEYIGTLKRRPISWDFDCLFFPILPFLSGPFNPLWEGLLWPCPLAWRVKNMFPILSQEKGKRGNMR